MNKTGIEYLTHSWNPIVMRCTPVSEGCENCWHLAMCKRHAANPYLTAEVRAAKAGGSPVLLDGELEAPYRLRKPARIGVQFMGDLFHPSVPNQWIDQVMARIGLAGQHTFLVLTKRAERMAEYFAGGGPVSAWGGIAKEILGEPVRATFPGNLWLGVTVENQKRADERIPLLLKIPAAVKFLSCEPLLSALDLTWVGTSSHYDYTRWNALTGEAHAVAEGTDIPWDIIHPMGSSAINSLIIGCESGPKRRPCKLEWVESLVQQADAAGVPVFVKQLEIDGTVTSDPADWPQWARRREFPV